MITIKYTCEQCGIARRDVQVPARTTEDVVAWVREIVARCVADDHARTSPGCTSRKMSELLIPLPPESEFIGQQIE